MKSAALAFVPHVPWTLLGMILFLTVFVALVIRTYTTSADSYQKMAAMPLDDEGVNHE